MTAQLQCAKRWRPCWNAGRWLGPDHIDDLTGFRAIGETAMTTERAIEIAARGLPTPSTQSGVPDSGGGALARPARAGGFGRRDGETDFSGYRITATRSTRCRRR
jgi:hypothetical protein